MDSNSPESTKPFDKIVSVVLTILLGMIFFLAITRLIKYAALFADESLQVDFSAYYTAGESLNAGLSPYKNNVTHIPPIWDGIARYKYSRFLYPPLVASFFQPIALLSYFQAKILWEILTVIFIVATLIVTSRIFLLRDLQVVFLIGIFIALFPPLLLHLERGQVDALTLLLITTAFWLMTRGDEQNDYRAGIILSIAVLFKLYSLFFLPFILIRKRWRSMKGFLFGTLAWIILTFVVQQGGSHLLDYGYNHLPRIANLGNIAASDTLVDKRVIRSVLAAAPAEFDTLKDGRGYQLASMQFTSNATLIEPLHDSLEAAKLIVPNSYLSIGVFGLLFLLVWLWQSFIVRLPLSPKDEFIYWQVPSVVVLLAAPLTWTMNVVWLIPLFIVVTASFLKKIPWIQFLSLSLVSIGLILAMLPDNFNLPVLSSLWNIMSTQKYVYAESIIFIGLMIWFIRRRDRTQPEG
jgi:hypothetical protein